MEISPALWAYKWAQSFLSTSGAFSPTDTVPQDMSRACPATAGLSLFVCIVRAHFCSAMTLRWFSHRDARSEIFSYSTPTWFSNVCEVHPTASAALAENGQRPVAGQPCVPETTTCTVHFRSIPIEMRL